ncbi:MAG: F0F1 ATP synthase subunit B [Candidatus Omnitrophica bacterium]|nr:F0F1 ATP synthase subunit B [Candidatus Omnitrophota bacterium]MDD5737604.1 F0F1 ATP synthase subunit B [Candidatus Omnitrophota bacterium]
MELLRSLSANEIVAQVVSFLLLLTLLRIFAWKKLLKMLDDRRERIASEFRRIDEAQSAVEKLKADYDKRLAGIEAEARAKIQEAVAEGKKVSQEIREGARQEARAILDKAQENIEIEVSKAKQELKEKVVELTLGTTEKLLKEKITDEKDRRLASDFLDELEKVK